MGEELFQKTYCKLWHPITAWLSRKLWGLNLKDFEKDSEDIAIEAFEKARAESGLPLYQYDRENFEKRTWQIARNCHRNLYRRWQRRNQVDISVVGEIPASDPDPCQQLILKEDSQSKSKYSKKLTPKNIKLIELIKEGHPFKEAGEILGLTPTAVSSAVHRIKNKTQENDLK